MTTPTKIEVTVPFAYPVSMRDPYGNAFNADVAEYRAYVLDGHPMLMLVVVVSQSLTRENRMIMAPFDVLPHWAPAPPEWFWVAAAEVVGDLAFKPSGDDVCRCGQPATELGECEACRHESYAVRTIEQATS